ncbi:phage baseplate plug family protein [Lelliottia wanjuensis]|uniref:phage baseplate plug family protein n=1 Tax=Lelliottia wanjuensis TaxID=3050585 RepID=UPI00254F8551|nr:hypothetical protein [Lelliottia sp. V104_15]MDK9607116.1 hypothetical protein [Lelliottia sp. V104_15]
MATYKLPISSDPRQRMTFNAGGMNVSLTMYYNPIPDGGQWFIDLADAESDEVLVSGYAIVCGAPILKRMTLPFYFRLIDTSGLNLNPYGGNDMGSRCELHVIEK